MTFVLGKVINVAFFEDCGMSPNLRLAADTFLQLSAHFRDTRAEYLRRHERA